MNIDIKYGWFIERPIGEYDDVTYYGVFDSDIKAKEYIVKLKAELFKAKTGSYDMNPVFLPYVEFENNIVPLCFQTYCQNVKCLDDV